jgi:hypothetical protein
MQKLGTNLTQDPRLKPWSSGTIRLRDRNPSSLIAIRACLPPLPKNEPRHDSCKTNVE